MIDKMTKSTLSQQARDAVSLLGMRIRLARKEKGWTEEQLAERAGIARATLRRVEQGRPSCAIGTVFELAVLVGVTLFVPDGKPLSPHLQMVSDKLSLLPQRVRIKDDEVFDDF